MGGFKLNTNGCSIGNPGRAWGGGVLCDGEGKLLLTFSTSFGSSTSIQAEARALLFRVNFYISREYVRVQVEVDTLVLVQILKQAIRCLWSIDTEVWALLQLSSHFICICHCFREGNQVAYCLSNIGCDEGGDRTYHQFSNLPTKARGAFRLDRIGLPSLRNARATICLGVVPLLSIHVT